MTDKAVLIIGNKNLSSWSLRPWLVLRHFEVPFEETKLLLDTDQFRATIRNFSPSARVPVLHHGARVIWDSLAINEYVNEVFLDDRGWPNDLDERAFARSISAEMHSGFASLRQQMPMNCVLRTQRLPSAETAADIERISAIWREGRKRFSVTGPFLCGGFSIADAMYAPVVLRFRSYGVALDPILQAYADTMLALPALIEWLADAEQEVNAVA
jgi:glutathione S-transferase